MIVLINCKCCVKENQGLRMFNDYKNTSFFTLFIVFNFSVINTDSLVVLVLETCAIFSPDVDANL